MPEIPAAEPVVPFPDGAFERVLCVVAHPDDVEYGSSSAVAAWTDGRGGGRVPPADPRRGGHGRQPARQDGEAAGRGAAGRVRGRRRDRGRLPGLPGRRPRVLPGDAPRHRPGHPAPAPGRGAHRHLGGGVRGRSQPGRPPRRRTAALDAVRDAGNRWVFPDLLDEGLEPWSPRWLLVAGDARPTHGVDVTGEPLERGIASLEAHGRYLAGIPGHPPPRQMITAITAMQGRRLGVPNAVLLRAFDFHAPPPIALQAMEDAADA